MSINYTVHYTIYLVSIQFLLLNFFTPGIFFFFAVYDSSINCLNMAQVYYRIFLSFLSNILAFGKQSPTHSLFSSGGKADKMASNIRERGRSQETMSTKNLFSLILNKKQATDALNLKSTTLFFL